MIAIWKYPLEVVDKQVVRSAIERPLAVEVIDGSPYLWAVVNTEQEPWENNIYTYGTGHEIPNFPGQNYIGTYLLHHVEGHLVFHVFIEGGDPSWA